MSKVWIIDFGSQYTQIITRKSRELGYHSIIKTYDESVSLIKSGQKPVAVILSGGPQSIFEDDNDYNIFFDLEVPTLGICYGMQIISHHFEGEVKRGTLGEYGNVVLTCCGDFEVAKKKSNINVWMSHFDEVTKAPENFDIILKSHNGLLAGIENKEKKILAYQFHPEVFHTDHSQEFLEYFFIQIAQLEADWENNAMLEESKKYLEQVKDEHILCAFSGGVDSLVAAKLCDKYLDDPKKLHCFFVDNGLLRPQDHSHIQVLKEKLNLNIEIIDAKEIFLKELKGVVEPEKKRKIIGKTFIDVFEKKVREYEKSYGVEFKYLLQGTLYPDVIESISPHKKGGKSVTIKSHHNVGGLPEKMALELLEPLRYLFKDEVRKIGEELGLERKWVHRHPFPGPGIGVRVLGELTQDNIRKVQESDQILFEQLHKHEQYDRSWQAFTVLLPIKTVGVKGDARAYEEVICIRVVNSVDGMTATWTDLPYQFLTDVSARITNEVQGITRVVYDITSKPPGTIEWE